jgi:phospholipase C
VKRCVGIVLALMAAISVAPSARAAEAPVKHVFTVIFENKSYDETFDPNGDAPYIAKKLPKQGATLENYYATGHLSLDNYISMVSGQAPNVQTQADCQIFTEFAPAVPVADGQYVGQGCVYPTAVKTVADQLSDAGLSWRGYMQDMDTSCRHPAVGAQDDTQSAEVGDQYATRHNPFMYFHSIIDRQTYCEHHVVDLKRMNKDLRHKRTTPAYSFITPDLCHDGHDAPCVDGRPGGLVQIDRFLRHRVPKITRSPGFKDHGLLLLTFDEAASEGDEGDASACCNEQPGPNTPNPGGVIPGPGGGRVGMVALSPCIKPGSVIAEPFNHYSMLRSIEDMFGLDHLGFAAQSGLKTFNKDLFAHGSC